MTKEQVLNSIPLKKRFAKDMNLSISVFDNPYFEHQLSIIDRYKSCLIKWNRFCEELQNFADETAYFEYYNSVKDEIITFIQNTYQYQRFNDSKVYDFKTGKYVSRDVYKEDNLSKCLISVDMKQANFNTMKFFEPWMFNGCQTWAEFMSKFTNKAHIIDSKYIRQVILGACNPGRQIKAETALMTSFADQLNDAFEHQIVSVSADEIIINVTRGHEFDEILSWAQRNDLLSILKLEQFTLEKLSNNIGWVKHISRSSNGNPTCDNRKVLKCVSCLNFCQVLKYMYDIPITEEDLVFHYEGRLCKFLEPLPNPFVT